MYLREREYEKECVWESVCVKESVVADVAEVAVVDVGGVGGAAAAVDGYGVAADVAAKGGVNEVAGAVVGE